MSFETGNIVLKLANHVFLAFYIFTQNHKNMALFTEKLEFDEVQINVIRYSIDQPPLMMKSKFMDIMFFILF